MTPMEAAATHLRAPRSWVPRSMRAVGRRAKAFGLLGIPVGWFGALALGLTSPGHPFVAGGLTASSPSAAAQPAQESEEGQPFDFDALLARDQEASFPPTAGGAALDRLQSEALSPSIRAAALITLGETLTSSGRSQCEAWMRKGTTEERCAAVFAWGKMGGFLGGEDPVLVEMLSDSNLRVAEAALFALYVHKPKPALDRLAYLVARPDEPLFQAAEHVLEWHERGTCSRPGPVSHYLNLRWQAARTFGTVYGQLWSAHLVELLGEDLAFLDAVLLPVAGEMIDPRVQDILFELLLRYPNEDGPAVAALIHMPALVDRLVEGGLWIPGTESQRQELLEVAEARGLARFLPNLLSRLALEPDYTLRVSGWLVSRDARYQEVIDENLRSPEPSFRAVAARAAGQASLSEWVIRLRDLSRDPNPTVRLEALIARVRAGDEKAHAPLHGYFHANRAEITDGVRDRAMRLMLTAYNGRVLDLVETIYRDLLPGFEKTCLAAVLVQGGRPADSQLIRDYLDFGITPAFWHLQMIQALGASRLSTDQRYLEDAFPQQGAFEVNAALARALLSKGSEDVLPLLKIALWQGDWNRSFLAGLLLSSKYGQLRLMQWLERPPEDAAEQDLRRVGFIVGSLGGIEAVETLKRHLRASVGVDRPELQGALLGALTSRTY